VKAALIVEIPNEAALDAIRKHIEHLVGTAPQLVSSFGIDLGNDEVTDENGIHVPVPPLRPLPRRGRVAEQQEAQVYLTSMEGPRFVQPEDQFGVRRQMRPLVDAGYITATLELRAPYEDQSIVTVLQRAQRTGMIALRNVE
jgi:hypothetical protein